MKKFKVNIACGKQTWDGFFCVDAVKHPKATRDPDLLHAFKFDGDRLVNPLPLEDGCASEVHSYHFLEHVYWWEAPALVGEFHRLLKPGGRLILELPDLAKSAKNLIDGKADQMSMWGIYGDPAHKDPFMCHRWGYTPATLQSLLEGAGFVDIVDMLPQKHGARQKRDMRAEARKP
jgi:predicted SAM-dependent methyltransferase